MLQPSKVPVATDRHAISFPANTRPGFRNADGVLQSPGTVIKLKATISAINMANEPFTMMIGAGDGKTLSNTSLQVWRVPGARGC